MEPIKTYACYNINDEIRKNSSSGAVFSALAEYIFARNGVVYGVAMTKDCYSAEFIAVTDLKGLDRLRGSKYLQARAGSSYKKVKDDLDSGKIVLFTGTGCQINGLLNYLGKKYDNLICVDVVCHGVPSPALWKKYALYQEQKNRRKLESVNFRYKDANWADSGAQKNALYIPKDKDPYMQMFLRNYCLRPSCYTCMAKNVKMADITIADFWGIDEAAPEMNDERGISLVLIRTVKGEEVFTEVSRKCKRKEVSYTEGVKGNVTEYKSVERPPQRNEFYKYMSNMGFEELEKKYVTQDMESFMRRLKRKVRDMLRNASKNGQIKHNDCDFGLLYKFK